MISMHTVEWLYSYLTNQNFNMIDKKTFNRQNTANN